MSDFVDQRWNVPEELTRVPLGLTEKAAAQFAKQLYSVLGDAASEYANAKMGAVSVRHAQDSLPATDEDHEEIRCWFLTMCEVDRLRGLYHPAETAEREEIIYAEADDTVCQRWNKVLEQISDEPISWRLNDLAEVDIFLRRLEPEAFGYLLEWAGRQTVLDRQIGSPRFRSTKDPINGEVFRAVSAMWVLSLFELVRTMTTAPHAALFGPQQPALLELKRKVVLLRAPFAKMQIAGKREEFYPSEFVVSLERETGITWVIKRPDGTELQISRRELSEDILSAFSA